ncbi:unnamed protein product, partial [Symbiodinium pilosum]
AYGNQCPGFDYDAFIKNTFIHFPAPPEPELLQRGRTAPAQVHEDKVAAGLEPDSEPESEPQQLPDFTKFDAEHVPLPDMLCRHRTHDVFEHFDGEGLMPQWPCYQVESMPVPEQMENMQYNAYGQGNTNEMEFVPAWDGQIGVPSGGEVMHPAPGTAVFVLHPPPCVAPDGGFNGTQPYLMPVHFSPMNSISPESHDWQSPPNWSGEDPQPELQFMPPVVPVHSFFPGAGEQEADQQILTFRKEDLLPEREEHPQRSLSEHDRFWDGLGVELLHQPQKIGRSQNMDHVYWVVDSNKLNDKAKVLVSPEFKVTASGDQLSFKMVMYPKDRTSFRQAEGQGFVQLKCESDTQDFDECSLSFRLAICNGRSGEKAKRNGPGNPVTWDFKRSLVCDDDEVKKTWNFKDVVDDKTRTFAVCIEILSAVATKP